MASSSFSALTPSLTLCIDTEYQVYFLFFAVGQLLFLLVLGIANLWFSKYVPTILLVAREHGITPSVIIGRVTTREWSKRKQRFSHYLRLDKPRVLPHTTVLMWLWRTARGYNNKRHPTIPVITLPLATGVVAELEIPGVFPKSKCFVQGGHCTPLSATPPPP